MKCGVGDRVRFLNDVGGGRVTRIVKNTVYVMSEDGFEVPVLNSEVIVVDQSTDNNFQNFSSDKKSTKENIVEKVKPVVVVNDSINTQNDLASLNFLNKEAEEDYTGEMVGVFLAFVPTNSSNVVESNQQLFIINDSPYRFFYCVSKWLDNKIQPIKAGFMYPDSKEMVVEFKREQLNSDITLNIQCLFFKNVEFVPQQPEFYDLRLNPTKFFRPGSFVENDFFDERAIIYSIADTKKEELLKTLTDKNINSIIEKKDSKPIVPIKVKEPEVEEVDLHIHELVENPKDFSPGQIIEMQLARFKVALEGGLKGNSRKMVFIHGVGNGKLKLEIRKELEKNYSKLKFQDASFREYGYGATMVFLRGK
jgi:hypothetical protein